MVLEEGEMDGDVWDEKIQKTKINIGGPMAAVPFSARVSPPASQCLGPSQALSHFV